MDITSVEWSLSLLGMREKGKGAPFSPREGIFTGSFHHELLRNQLLWSAGLCAGSYQLPIIKTLTNPGVNVRLNKIDYYICGAICVNDLISPPYASTEARMES